MDALVSLDDRLLHQRSSINLAVPFVSQAPFADWKLPYQEACEEASVILLDAFYKKRSLTPEQMDRAILDLVEWEKKRFGFYEHTTAEDTATILREYFEYERVRVFYDMSLQDLKRELSAGRPVIVPLAGREVGNRFYRRPGPVYHMLLIKGFTNDGRLITNDVGTRHGADYPYDSDVFFAAIHDAPSSGSASLEPLTMEHGRKAMIVVGSSYLVAPSGP